MIPALITGGASILSGLLSAVSQSTSAAAQRRSAERTNELNYRIWQEQKAHNIDMFNLENQANIDMWNMANEYNDPSAQVDRLRSAGLNPYLAMQSGNPSGVATNAPSAGDAQPASAPQMQMLPSESFNNGLAAAVSQAMQTFAIFSQADLNDANASSVRGMLPFYQANLSSDTNMKLESTDFMKALKDDKLFDLYFKRDTRDIQYQMKEQVLVGQKVQNAYNSLKVSEQSVINHYLEPQQLMSLGTMYYSMVESYYRGQINGVEFKQMDKYLKAKLRNIESSTYKNYSSAEKDYTGALKDYADIEGVNAEIRSKDASSRLANANAYGQELRNGALVRAWNEYCEDLRMQFAAGIMSSRLSIGQNAPLVQQYEDQGLDGFLMRSLHIGKHMYNGLPEFKSNKPTYTRSSTYKNSSGVFRFSKTWQ